MAKRQMKRQNSDDLLSSGHLKKILWGIVIIVCVLFGYSYGYPVAARGELLKGILVGLAYGGGAFIVVLISFFLNQKLKGL